MCFLALCYLYDIITKAARLNTLYFYLGHLVRTFIFQPMVSAGSRQTMRLFVPYPDDMIALEPDEYFNYYLTNPIDVSISSPKTSQHRLVDDDGTSNMTLFIIYMSMLS